MGSFYNTIVVGSDGSKSSFLAVERAAALAAAFDATLVIGTAYYQSEEDASKACLLYTSPSPRDATLSRMPSSA